MTTCRQCGGQMQKAIERGGGVPLPVVGLFIVGVALLRRKIAVATVLDDLELRRQGHELILARNALPGSRPTRHNL
jgi:hypothetical protein